MQMASSQSANNSIRIYTGEGSLKLQTSLWLCGIGQAPYTAHQARKYSEPSLPHLPACQLHPPLSAARCLSACPPLPLLPPPDFPPKVRGVSVTAHLLCNAPWVCNGVCLSSCLPMTTRQAVGLSSSAPCPAQALCTEQVQNKRLKPCANGLPRTAPGHWIDVQLP